MKASSPKKKHLILIMTSNPLMNDFCSKNEYNWHISNMSSCWRPSHACTYTHTKQKELEKWMPPLHSVRQNVCNTWRRCTNTYGFLTIKKKGIPMNSFHGFCRNWNCVWWTILNLNTWCNCSAFSYIYKKSSK